MTNSEYNEAYYAEVQRKKTIMIRGILIGIIAVSIVGIGVWKVVLPALSPSTPVLGASTDLTDPETIQRVGSHMILPVGETPKVVTVSNVEEMKKTQPFFNSASNGDKLIIYSNKVVLYSPVSDRIIDIAQIRYSPPAQHN